MFICSNAESELCSSVQLFISTNIHFCNSINVDLNKAAFEQKTTTLAVLAVCLFPVPVVPPACHIRGRYDLPAC